jgi:hypothetical protein
MHLSFEMDAPLAFCDLLIAFDDEFGRSGFRIDFSIVAPCFVRTDGNGVLLTAVPSAKRPSPPPPQLFLSQSASPS